MDEKSIENGLEGQKFLVVCLFWGGCHHPNFDVEWGRQYTHLFSKEGGGRLTKFQGNFQVPLAPVVSRVHAKLIKSCSVYVSVLKHVITL